MPHTPPKRPRVTFRSTTQEEDEFILRTIDCLFRLHPLENGTTLQPTYDRIGSDFVSGIYNCGPAATNRELEADIEMAVCFYVGEYLRRNHAFEFVMADMGADRRLLISHPCFTKPIPIDVFAMRPAARNESDWFQCLNPIGAAIDALATINRLMYVLGENSHERLDWEDVLIDRYWQESDFTTNWV